jgi:hypothetical protein
MMGGIVDEGVPVARWIRLGVVLAVLLGLVGTAWVILDRLGKKPERPRPTVDLTVIGDRGKTVKTFTVDFRNPLYSAEIGDWAIYRRLGGQYEKRVIVREGRWGRDVHRTSPDVYVLEVHASTDEGETWLPNPAIQPTTRGSFGLGTKFVVQSITRDDIECAGRTWRAWRVDGHYPAGVGGMTAWITDQHPLGVLRIKSRLRPEGVDDEWNYEYVSHGSD